MADEASTQTSTEQTAGTTATNDAATAETKAETTSAKADDLGTTALGDAGDAAPEKTDQTGETAETKGDEAERAKGEVPETYELTPPEGFEALDERVVEAAVPIFKELGLTNEQANRLMPLAGQLAKNIVAEREQQFNDTVLGIRKQWLDEAKGDKEIGGAHWQDSVQASARALDQLGFPSKKDGEGNETNPLRKALNESGFGNHPEMVRLMARVGKAIGEDSNFVRSDADAAVKPKDDRELFYPGSTKSAG